MLIKRIKSISSPKNHLFFCLIAMSVLFLNSCSTNHLNKNFNIQNTCSNQAFTDSTHKAQTKVLAKKLDTQGNQFFLQRVYSEAKECYKQALKIRAAHLSKTHPSIFDNLINLATLAEVTEEYDIAKKHYINAKKLLNPKSPHHRKKFHSTKAFLFAINAHNKSFGNSIKTLKLTITGYQQILGQTSMNLSTTRHQLANLYLQEKQYSKSEKEFTRSLGTIQKFIGTQHPYFAKVLYDYAHLLKYRNKHAQAEKIEQRADSIMLKFPKKQHVKLYQKQQLSPRQ